MLKSPCNWCYWFLKNDDAYSFRIIPFEQRELLSFEKLLEREIFSTYNCLYSVESRFFFYLQFESAIRIYIL
jgi:hypothetical protein